MEEGRDALSHVHVLKDSFFFNIQLKHVIPTIAYIKIIIYAAETIIFLDPYYIMVLFKI